MGARFLRFTTLLSLLSLLSGCTTTTPVPQVVQGQTPTDDGFLTVVLGPGAGRSCAGSPCSVYYRTPQAGGEVEIIANNFSLGSFPAGKVVSLGQFNDTVRITVRGADAAPAFVNIPRDNR